MNSNMYSMFSTDNALETNGIVLDYGAFRITVARAGKGNAAYRGIMADALKQHRGHDISDELGDRIMVGIYADSIILNWDGVTDAEGKELPYTRENVIKVLTDLPDLFADICEQASSAANFRQSELADAEKNLPKSSGTKPASADMPSG